MTALIDANVLIALAVVDHVHHDPAERWLAARDASFATCPITEGSLVRHLLRRGQDAATAQAVITALHEHPGHEFWEDSVSYRDVPLAGVIGHRQVTDAYLVQLARAHQGKLVTFDRGIAGAHGGTVELIDAG